MGRNRPGNLNPGHLTSDDQNRATAASSLAKEATEVPIPTAVNHRDLCLAGELWLHGWLAEVSGRDKQVIKVLGAFFSLGASTVNSPFRAWLATDGTGDGVSRHDCSLEPEPCALAVSPPVPLKIAPDLPGSRNLETTKLPSEVAELHGMLALVCHHERVHQPFRISSGRRPKTAYARLSVQNVHLKSAG